jgi:hypothetical protein
MTASRLAWPTPQGAERSTSHEEPQTPETRMALTVRNAASDKAASYAVYPRCMFCTARECGAVVLVRVPYL